MNSYLTYTCGQHRHREKCRKFWKREGDHVHKNRREGSGFTLLILALIPHSLITRSLLLIHLVTKTLTRRGFLADYDVAPQTASHFRYVL